MRAFGRDLIRGGHYGQRSCEPHLKAEHMAAPTNAAYVKKALANSEPSTHGTFLPCQPRRAMSDFRAKPPDIGSMRVLLGLTQGGHDSISGGGAHQCEHAVGPMRVGGPDLLPVDDVVIPVRHGPRLQGCEVGARAGFGIALRPIVLARTDAWEILVLLRRRPIVDDDGPDEMRAGRIVGGH